MEMVDSVGDFKSSRSLEGIEFLIFEMLDANEKIETGAVVTNRRGSSRIERGKGICYQWKAKGQCSRGGQCSFWHDGDECAKSTPKDAPSSEHPSPRGRSASRKGALEARVRLGRPLDSRAKTS